MKINTEIKIKVYWDEKEKVNKTTFDIDVNSTPSVILTAFEMTKNSITELIENHIKENYPTVQCTKKELKKIMNTNFDKLTTPN